jgi:transglutaminase-like putative cysteine protease
MDAEEYFSKSETVKSIEAIIYDGSGAQLKKIKRKDFREASVSEGYSVTDNKVIYLVYTPVQYPFTIVYTSETETGNTAFIPQWSAVEGAYLSTEKSEMSITCKPELGFKSKEYNFDGTGITKEQSGNTLTYKAANIPATKREDYSPSYLKMAPYVTFGLEKFNLEGVEGSASTWEAFGAWYYNTLLVGTDELSPETVAKIQTLTAGETEPLKKAKIVYEYMQSKTRYVSIQLGIGGWKPMLAKDVDRLGYGDCKALSNYTRALLKAVGVESYCVVIYGSDGDKRDIREDFVSMQGNHMILAIPNNNTMVWLECTSQNLPFGFQGDFTNDRNALVLKPGKGEIVKTHVYDNMTNSQATTGSYTISENGSISAHVSILSKGLQYSNVYMLETKAADEREKYYKQHLGSLVNMKIRKVELKNKKEAQEFTEDLTIDSEGYCSKSGTRMMFAVNAFNTYDIVPQRYRSRKNPFEVRMGFYDTDEVIISLPAGFTLEAMPQNITITDKFGEYKAEYSMAEPGKILFKRALLIKEGQYKPGEYENYRLFREKIARNDNAKVVLVKT